MPVINVSSASASEELISLSPSPAELGSFLDTVGADRVLIVGPSGVGKSTAVMEYAERTARKLGRRLIDVKKLTEEELAELLSLERLDDYYLFFHIYAPTIRPEDLQFISQKPDGTYDWSLPRRLQLFAKPGASGIIFIDEITSVQLPDVESALYSLVLDKSVANFKFNGNVEVVAAGNRPEDSAIARYPSRPLRQRFRYIILVKPPTVDEWIEWMKARYGDAWDPSVAAVLKARPDLLTPTTSEEDYMFKVPDPRTWTALAIDLHRVGRTPFTRIMVRAALGPKYGAIVDEMIARRPPVAEFIENPREAAPRVTDPIDRYLIIAAVARRNDLAKKEHLPKLAEIVRAVIETWGSEYFVVLFKMSSNELTPGIATVLAENKELVDKVTDTLGRVLLAFSSSS